MAANTSAATNASSSTGEQTVRHGNGEEAGSCESGKMAQNTIVEKTHEFFQICDIEDKGFITRRDMQRLNGELPLSAEELENVFDTLDSDGNGYLTLDEFSSGFSEFLHGKETSVDEGMGEKGACASSPEALNQMQWEKKLAACEDDEEQHFCMLMDSLGANSVFEDPREVRDLWAKLRRDEPHLLSNFEDFLARVTSQIIEAKRERSEMESALERKAAAHDNEIKRLYEEMEQQIKNEKDKIVLKDYEQFLSRSRDLELQLSNKEREKDMLFQKQKKLERQCSELHSEKCVTKVENVKLKQTNGELAQELAHTSQELALAQEQLNLLQEQSTRLHEEKEMEIYRQTEGLHRERASLLKQLDLLREVNKHLREERDMFYQKSNYSKKMACNQVTLNNALRHTHITPNNFKSEQEEMSTSPVKQNPVNGPSQLPCAEETINARQPTVRRHLPRIISIEEDHLPHLLQQNHQAQPPLQRCNEREEAAEGEEDFDLEMSDICPHVSSHQQEHPEGQMKECDTPTDPRGQPLGKESSLNEEGASLPPDRFFKIILIGNSSVGKTSILRRFCDDCFFPGTSATVGIDYTVKTLTVDNSQVALQLWDTAGQERYRSITKQFFRKADGVVVIYDITAEESFKSVRQWLTNVQDCAGEDLPIMLLGNKTDKESERRVQRVMGESLAKECELAFYECSACSGHNVTESMVHLARLLTEQEDREREKTIQLVSSATQRKKVCC